MDYELAKKEYQIASNWRAQIARYAGLRKSKKVKTPGEYCQKVKINYDAFILWLKHIEEEDEYVFYVSFVTERFNLAKRSLELLEEYIENDDGLRMALMRDAIVAYVSPFKRTERRAAKNPKLIKNGLQLSQENLVPRNFQEIHNEICHHRDQIIAHCDINPRNPRVSIFGISIKGKGYYWNDYKALFPKFKELILAVEKKVQEYNKKKIELFRKNGVRFEDLPQEAQQDPGFPPNKIL